MERKVRGERGAAPAARSTDLDPSAHCENMFLFQLSHKQVQKMNQVTMEKDQDLTSLKKKLEGMVKLNKALTDERSQLMNKIKDMVII